MKEVVCSTCNEPKPELAFAGNSRGGLRASCRDCVSKRNRKKNLKRRLETVMKKAWKTTLNRGQEWNL